jgi:23S rRNA (cytidine1920-2'-O)/16S rRNA (cytidine1409-2'-O)-methyltransferase
VLEDVLSAASMGGYAPLGLIPSPLRGPSGNVEFLLWLAQTEELITPLALRHLIDNCLDDLPEEHTDAD